MINDIKLFISILFYLSLTRSVDAQIAVIVNTGNPNQNITISELKEVYLGEKKKWGDGTKIVLVDQKSNKQLSNQFYKATTGKSLSGVKEIWVKKMLTGEMSPPKAFNSDALVVDYVSRNDGAIGFIESANASTSVRVLSVDGKSPGSDGYQLK